MISQKISIELNKQFSRETAAAYSYFALSLIADEQSFSGAAKWLRLQAQEELGHAMKLHRYIVDRGGRVTLTGVEQPKIDANTLVKIFEIAHQNEVQLGKDLENLAQLALEERDNTTYQFLQWYLNEQVEEIGGTLSIVERLRRVGDNGTGLLLIDNELGSRN